MEQHCERRPAVGAPAAILLASVGLLAANVFLPLRLHDLGAAPSLIALSTTASALFESHVMLLGRRFVERLRLRGFFALDCFDVPRGSCFVDRGVHLSATLAKHLREDFIREREVDTAGAHRERPNTAKLRGDCIEVFGHDP